MGVSGAGKTTLGLALAASLGWRFADADDYHPPENVARMRAGHGLTDDDRKPWLAALRVLIAEAVAEDDPLVLACSALRAEYRMILAPPGSKHGAVRFIHLDVDAAELARRLRSRSGHFAGVSLLESQLATLEPPVDALHLDGTKAVDELVAEVRRAIGIAGSDESPPGERES